MSKVSSEQNMTWSPSKNYKLLLLLDGIFP